MDFNEIKELFLAAGYEPRSYSGRGMFGSRCLGVIGSSEAHIIIDVIRELCTWDDALDKIDSLLDALEKCESDSMGKSDQIIYWPDIDWEGDDADDDDDDEEE